MMSPYEIDSSNWPSPFGNIQVVPAGVEEIPPASKAQVEVAQTAHAEPETKPELRIDVREAAIGLTKACRNLEEVFAQTSGTNNVLFDELRRSIATVTGARILVERAAGLPRRHHLKCDPVPFDLAVRRLKPYEVRKFDRDFRVGDIVVLQEFDRDSRTYSGRTEERRITTITEPGTYGLPPDVGVLGLEPTS